MRRLRLLMIALVCIGAAAQALAVSEMFNPFTGNPDYIADLPEICDGPTGLTGSTGATGATGATGPTGPGVAAGGTDGQYLAKKGMSNYSTHWVDPSQSVAWGNITGTISNQTDLTAAFEPKNSNIQAHIGSTNNPHATTADQVLPTQTGNNGKVLGTNGTTASWVAAGSATPGGNTREMQYNNGGVFAGAAYARYSAYPGGGALILTGKMVIK